MKEVKAYSIESEIINCVREFAWALNKSESQLVEDFIKQGIKHIDKTVKIHPIYRFNAETSTWEGNINFKKLHCFSRLELSNVSYNHYSKAHEFYSSVFSKLAEKNEWNVEKHIHFFQIQYNQIQNFRKNKDSIPWSEFFSSMEVE